MKDKFLASVAFILSPVTLDVKSMISMKIMSFHDHIMLNILIILFMVLYIMVVFSLNKFSFRMFYKSEILEAIWTVVPGIFLINMALPSLHVLYLSDEVMNPLMTIKVVGHQWYWTYEYSDFEMDGDFISFNSYMIPDNDGTTIRLLEVDNNLIIPSDTSVRMIITSDDVIHSWSVQSLGLKLDAIPGRLNQGHVMSSFVGLLYGQCSEICGTMHSFMPICVEVVPMNNFFSWVEGFK